MPNTLSPEIPEGYSSLLSILKERIREARFRSSLAVNRELILLYWQIGNDILARQDSEGWGAKTIDRLAADLRRDFPAYRPRHSQSVPCLSESERLSARSPGW